MYLNITPRANNRKYLSIVHGYRDENGKVKKDHKISRVSG